MVVQPPLAFNVVFQGVLVTAAKKTNFQWGLDIHRRATNASHWQLVSRKAFYFADTFSAPALRGSPQLSHYSWIGRQQCYLLLSGNNCRKFSYIKFTQKNTKFSKTVCYPHFLPRHPNIYTWIYLPYPWHFATLLRIGKQRKGWLTPWYFPEYSHLVPPCNTRVQKALTLYKDWPT